MSTTPLLRCTRNRRCPICGRTDWCSVGEDGATAICMRIGDGARRQTRNGGYLHVLRESDYHPVACTRRVAVPAAPMLALAERVRWWEQCLTLARREAYAESLGVDPAALGVYAVGWAREYGAYSHPMLDHAGRIVGVRLRNTDGRKWSVRGGHEGIFAPRRWPPMDSTWYVVEGASDALAGYSVGLDCIGRPSCTGGAQTLARMVREHRPSRIVVVADGDTPGMAGAERLAHILMLFCGDVRILTPPPPAKDLRAWVQAGATAAHIEAAAEAALKKKYNVRGEQK